MECSSWPGPWCSLEPYPNPYFVLQAPWESFDSSRVLLRIPTCASGLIVDITYPENVPWHVNSGLRSPLCPLCILRSPWPTLPAILKEWTYEWIGLSWKCVVLVRGSSGCNSMGDGLRTIPSTPGVATLADYHMSLYEMPRHRRAFTYHWACPMYGPPCCTLERQVDKTDMVLSFIDLVVPRGG